MTVRFGGSAPSAITTMWVLTALTLVFVILRIYTRVWVVRAYGVDDHVYNLSFLLLLMYVIFTTISAYYGFGQSTADIYPEQEAVNAILFEAIGQTFAVIGMAVAKWSLGLFLLRLVTEPWHKITLWTIMIVLMATSTIVVLIFWLQCTPPAYLFDKRIKDGHCHINSTPVSMLLCILCVLVDFFFALFPWLFIWGLQMNKKEKLVILISMSLGIIAGACGIKRTLEVPELASFDYVKDTVGLIVWSAAEIAVTMICIGIPICRPLYRSFIEKLTYQLSKRDTRGSHRTTKLQPRGSSQQYRLQTFAGVEVVNEEMNMNYTIGILGLREERYDMTSAAQFPRGGAGNDSFATSAGWRKSEEGSEAEILGQQHGSIKMGADAREDGIRVIEEYQVTSSLR